MASAAVASFESGRVIVRAITYSTAASTSVITPSSSSSPEGRPGDGNGTGVRNVTEAPSGKVTATSICRAANPPGRPAPPNPRDPSPRDDASPRGSPGG